MVNKRWPNPHIIQSITMKLLKLFLRKKSNYTHQNYELYLKVHLHTLKINTNYDKSFYSQYEH